MVKSARAQMIAVLTIGCLLGYAAASTRLDVFRSANAGTSQQRVVDKAAVGTLRPSTGLPHNGAGSSVIEQANRSVKQVCGTSCMQGSVKPRLVAMANAAALQEQSASGKKPNIIFIMGDDIGWFNIGAYHQGIMAGRTPNLDRLAAQGMRFTDYYAEASCTAGRANFITGELPIRTGLTTVGQAGAKVGMPAQAPTIATALRTMGYATGQFGKNHLGDLNEYLPTVHGFDEFFGYLYHLDAM